MMFTVCANKHMHDDVNPSVTNYYYYNSSVLSKF